MFSPRQNAPKSCPSYVEKGIRQRNCFSLKLRDRMALPAGEDASRYLESRTLFFPNRDWLFLGSSANCVLTEGKMDFCEGKNAEEEPWFEPPQVMKRLFFGSGGKGRGQERYFSERKVISTSSGVSSGDQGRNGISAEGRAKRVMPDSSLSGVDRSGTHRPQTSHSLCKIGHKHTICG